MIDMTVELNSRVQEAKESNPTNWLKVTEVLMGFHKEGAPEKDRLAFLEEIVHLQFLREALEDK